MSQQSSHAEQAAVDRYRSAVGSLALPDAVTVAAAGPSPATTAGSDWSIGALALLGPWAEALDTLRAAVGSDPDLQARRFVADVTHGFDLVCRKAYHLLAEQAEATEAVE